MTTDTLVLADGERIVRRYSCTAVDRVALFAGTVVPVPGSVESEGILTLTDRRIVFDLEATGKRHGTMHQETRLSDVTSVSSMMSKFGRDLRIPILCMVLGLLMMFAPYLYFSETGQLDVDGDYQDGFNEGVEYGYFYTYMRAVQTGEVSQGIPDGYFFIPSQGPYTSEWAEGYLKGHDLGVERAEADIASDSPFSVPSDLLSHNDPALVILTLAIIGAVVFVLGSVLYLASNLTKDWMVLRLGTGGRGVFVTSVTGGWRDTGYRALTPDNQYWDMTRELGAAIVEIRNHREQRLRMVEVVEDDGDDVVIEGGYQTDGEEDYNAYFSDYDDDYDDGEHERTLIIDDDDGPTIIGPWREEDP